MAREKVLPENGRKISITITQEAYVKLCLAKVFHKDKSPSRYIEDLIIEDVKRNKDIYYEDI